MLDPELKKKWVAALRSGEYGQCTGQLADGKGNYCCLGVLAHITNNLETDLNGNICTKDGLFGNLGYDLATEFGLEGYFREMGQLPITSLEGFTPEYGDGNIVLSELNDNGYTFSQIADLIEEHL